MVFTETTLKTEGLKNMRKIDFRTQLVIAKEKSTWTCSTAL